MATKRRHDEADEDAAERVKRRNFFVVPKDQQQILNQEGSWFAALKNNPKAISSSVPAHVLQTLAALHQSNTTNVDTLENQLPQPRQQSRNTNSGPANGDDDRMSIHSQLQSPQASSPVRSIGSWSSSPERGAPAERLPLLVSQTIEQTPKSHSVEPAPSLRNASRKNVPVIFDFPSSDGSDIELEVGIPDAQPGSGSMSAPRTMPRRHQGPHVTSPLKSSMSIHNTPPCAQPPQVVPSTLLAPNHGKEPQGPVKNGKRRNPLVWEEDEYDLKLKAELIAAGKIRPRAVKTVHDVDSSNSTTSSSIIPATMAGPAEESRTRQTPSPQKVRAPKVLEASKNTKENQAASQPQATQTSSAVQTEAIVFPLSRKMVDAATQVDNDLLDRTKAAEEPAEQMNQDAKAAEDTTAVMGSSMPLSEGQDPYRHFCEAYPCYLSTYKGTKTYFIRAVAFLVRLRKEMILKQELYDDFVRTFSSGYMPYVKSANPGQEPQPAFEWYCWQDDEIMYNRRVLSKANLDLVQTAYPEEFLVELKKSRRSESPEMVRITVPHVREASERDATRQTVNIVPDVTTDTMTNRELSTNLANPPEASRMSVSAQIAASTSTYTSADQASPPSQAQRARSVNQYNAVTNGSPSKEQRQRSTSQVSNERATPRSELAIVDLTADDIDPPQVAPPELSMNNSMAQKPVRQVKSSTTSAKPAVPRTAAQQPPPSSSTNSVRRISSSGAIRKTRPGGSAYLKSLNAAAGDKDDARAARMRELGRMKRMSSGGSSFTSSRAS